MTDFNVICNGFKECERKGSRHFGYQITTDKRMRITNDMEMIFDGENFICEVDGKVYHRTNFCPHLIAACKNRYYVEAFQFPAMLAGIMYAVQPIADIDYYVDFATEICRDVLDSKNDYDAARIKTLLETSDAYKGDVEYVHSDGYAYPMASLKDTSHLDETLGQDYIRAALSVYVTYAAHQGFSFMPTEEKWAELREILKVA